MIRRAVIFTILQLAGLTFSVQARAAITPAMTTATTATVTGPGTSMAPLPDTGLFSSDRYPTAKTPAAPLQAAKPLLSNQQLVSLLDFTGINTQLPDIRRYVHAARDRHTQRCDTTSGNRPDTDPYSPGKLRAELIRYLRTTVSPNHLASVLQWYQSDLGTRVTASEKKSRPESSFETVTNNLKLNPEWDARESSITDIERYTKANKLGAIVGVEIEYGGLSLSGCLEKADLAVQKSKQTNRRDSDQVEGNHKQRNRQKINRERVMARIIRADRATMERIFYQDTIEGMAFSLQDLNRTDLRNYASFTQTTAARHVFSAVVEALDHTLQFASGTLTAEPPAMSSQIDE